MNWIEYITHQKKLSQKEIASRLGVSEPLITKWKKGEKIPDEHEEKLREIGGAFDENLEWAVLTENDKRNSEDWISYLKYHYERFDEDVVGIFGPELLTDLVKLGVNIPSNPKNIIEKESERGSDSPLKVLLFEHAEDYIHRLRWFETYLDYTDQDDYEVSSDKLDLESYVVPISLTMIKETTLLEAGGNLSQFEDYKEDILQKVDARIDHLCRALNQNNQLIRHDYFRFLHERGEKLADDVSVPQMWRSISDYMPYHVQKFSQDLAELKGQVSELNDKLDKLLADKNSDAQFKENVEEEKKRVGFWITEDEKIAVNKDMKQLGISSYSDYILYKCGIEKE